MKRESESFVVIYNLESDRIPCLPEYLVADIDGLVHTSNPYAIWRERPELVILGRL